MKQYIKFIAIFAASISLSSCTEWLTEPAPGVTGAEDFFTSESSAIQSVNGTYSPLSWEYNNTYYNEWFIGDIMSDDALKGGQNTGDMADAYEMENWKVNTNNSLLLEYYRAQFQGVARCNVALAEIPKISIDDTYTEQMQQRLLGEVYFMRAMYYFRLVRVFGGVPKVTEVLSSSDDWVQPRATAEDIYSLILADLTQAEAKLWLRSDYSEEDLGRATKGAAQAMLLKVNLYQKNFAKAAEWGYEVVQSEEYQLLDNYAANFSALNDNSKESVFEIQYMEEATSDYGEGNGFTRGTFTTIQTRSRSSQLGGGWGFNKPTQNLYDEFEEGDPRRDATILNPTDSQIDNQEEEIYLGSRYINRKSIDMDVEGNLLTLSHNARGAQNKIVIRYADVLLMYAEAAAESGDPATAKTLLEDVRLRARGSEDILPEFPYGTYSDSTPDLISAIRHERRVELAMEGHRWFDLCRWGVAKEVMDAYKATESTEAQSHMAEFIKGKHELLPIPSEEIDKNPMEQNPGY